MSEIRVDSITDEEGTGRPSFPNGIVVDNLGIFDSGSAGSPSITFDGDTNTGLFRPAADTLAASTNGSERMRIDSSGNVGIGTTAPSSALTIAGTVVSNSIEVGNLTTTQSGSTSALFKSVRAQKSNFDTETTVDCFQFDFAGSGSSSSEYGSISGTLNISQQGSTTGGTVREGFCSVNFIIQRNAFRTASLTLSSTDIIGTMSPTISLSSASNTQAILSLNLNAGNNREGRATAVIEAAAVGNTADDILTVTAL